jgi:thiamine kinase-like enzyme
MPHAHPADDTLTQSLTAALRDARSPWAAAALQRLPDRGLAHDHVRIAGSGLLARIPKQSQMRLAPADNLAYQAACFERAAAGGHAPRLHGVLAPSTQLPRGALLVQEVIGRTATLPADLPAIVQALAALHALPLPMPHARRPLLDDADALVALYEELAQQAQYLAAAAVASTVARAVTQELQRLNALCAADARPTRHLIAFDGHPGNFIVQRNGQAVLVDLEKCRYSYPSLDIAHATLYTSTTWDVESNAVLAPGQVHSAYAIWADAVGPRVAGPAHAWHVPLRRAMWLWSITWCAKWRVLSAADAPAHAGGEDWSASHSDAALVNHVRNRVDHYLSADVVERMRDEFDALENALGKALAS